MFQIALDIVKVNPQQIVFFDDRPMFVEAAQGPGIQGILHKSYDTTRRLFRHSTFRYRFKCLTNNSTTANAAKMAERD